MTETAMKDADNDPVFVAQSGAYSYVFPKENVVRRAKTEKTRFDVYGFVGENDNYTELKYTFKNENDAIDFATDIYGKEVDTVMHQGEVFEVEVHERDLDPTI